MTKTQEAANRRSSFYSWLNMSSVARPLPHTPTFLWGLWITVVTVRFHSQGSGGSRHAHKTHHMIFYIRFKASTTPSSPTLLPLRLSSQLSSAMCVQRECVRLDPFMLWDSPKPEKKGRHLSLQSETSASGGGSTQFLYLSKSTDKEVEMYSNKSWSIALNSYVKVLK